MSNRFFIDAQKFTRGLVHMDFKDAEDITLKDITYGRSGARKAAAKGNAGRKGRKKSRYVEVEL